MTIERAIEIAMQELRKASNHKPDRAGELAEARLKLSDLYSQLSKPLRETLK